MNDSLQHFRGYTITPVYTQITDELAREIISFWRDNSAIPDEQEALRRTREVVVVARNAASQIVGINSVYTGAFNASRHPWYYYRMFIRPQDRILGLGGRMTRVAVKFLRSHAISQSLPVAGIVLITENPKLMEPAGKRKLSRLGWEYIGRGPQGRDAWKVDF